MINPQIQFRRHNRSVASTTVNLWIQNGVYDFNFSVIHETGQSKFIPFENVNIRSQEHKNESSVRLESLTNDRKFNVIQKI